MIELKVEPYCQNCIEFEPDCMMSGIQSVGGECKELRTTINCKRLDKCREMEKRIRQYTDRQRGRWLHIAMGTYKCSVCNTVGRTKDAMPAAEYNYCPQCGAKMEAK